MKSLTTESLKFVREVKHKSKGIPDRSWHKGHTKLFEDLYEVVKDVTDKIEGLKLGLWKVNFGPRASESSTLSYMFKLENGTSGINLLINPMEDSYIDLVCSNVNGKELPKALPSFYTSSAYKRYFQVHQVEGVQLRAQIPSSQIGSRHLGAYIVHLIKMMSPVICHGQEIKSTVSQAA